MNETKPDDQHCPSSTSHRYKEDALPQGEQHPTTTTAPTAAAIATKTMPPPTRRRPADDHHCTSSSSHRYQADALPREEHPPTTTTALEAASITTMSMPPPYEESNIRRPSLHPRHWTSLPSRCPPTRRAPADDQHCTSGTSHRYQDYALPRGEQPSTTTTAPAALAIATKTMPPHEESNIRRPPLHQQH